jgi:hypothetical protein
MKKIVAMFAILMLLVLVALGQQATTVAPAQTPSPAPAKRIKATAARPAIATTVQNDHRAKGKVTTIAPAQTTIAPARTMIAPAQIETAVTVPARIGTPATINAAPIAPALATTVTPIDAAQVAAAPTAQTPSSNVRIVTPLPTQVTPTAITSAAPALAAQSIQGAVNLQPRIASTHPTALTAAQQPTTPAATVSGSREADSVSEKGFKGKVFEVKHREPYSLVKAVSALGSGFKGAQITSNEEFKTITVRDFPENIATIEEALKRLDTPQAPRPDIEFRIHVLIGSATAGQGEEVPADLKDVVNQLQSMLKYKNYSLMVSALHRTKEGGAGVSNNGVAESKLFNTVSVPSGNQIFYDYFINQISLDSSTSAGMTVQIGQLGFSLRIPLVIGAPNSPIQYQNVGFRSPVSLREGEKVVVGTTTMGDKGLIVVLTAKVNK